MAHETLRDLPRDLRSDHQRTSRPDPPLARRRERFDVAFLDPPYDTGTAAACVRAEGLRAIIPARCRLYVQHRRGAALPAAPGWRLADERRFGDTMLTTFEREEDDA